MSMELKSIRREVPAWVVDRIEEGWAVLNNTTTRESISLPVSSLPKKISPGDTLRKHHELGWFKDDAETAARAERIKNSFARIKAANNKP